MCGNGARCAAKFYADHHLKDSEPLQVFPMETASGIVMCKCYRDHPSNNQTSTWVAVNLNQPQILDPQTTISTSGSQPTPRDFTATLVSMGNHHCVIFDVEEPLADFPLATYGPLIEHHPRFPDRTNVEFVKVEGPLAVKGKC